MVVVVWAIYSNSVHGMIVQICHHGDSEGQEFSHSGRRESSTWEGSTMLMKTRQSRVSSSFASWIY